MYILFLKEYSEDSNSDPDIDLESQYYNSKALKEDDLRAALESFQRVNDTLYLCLICLSIS